MTGLPLSSTSALAASAADLTTTQDAMGMSEAVSAGSSKMYLRGPVNAGEMPWTGDSLGGVVVVGLDGLELEVDEVLGVEGALVGDFWLGGGRGLGRAVEVDVASQPGGTCGSTSAT